jgi:hypothetical protein
MLRIACLAALSLVACVEPVEEYHSVTWTVDPRVERCNEVRVVVHFETRTTSHDGYGCSASGGFVWSSDDPPLSVEITAFHVSEEPCEGLSSLWCTTTTVLDVVGSAEGELDLTSDSTAFVITR